MWDTLRLLIICGITYSLYGDPELHEPLGIIVFFSILVAYGTTWLLFQMLRLLTFLK